jgi:hydroxymethylpyrimidine/phosphomethylpyrimidine kinase
MQGRVLIIAGSDSGGGAGIQADIKAVTMMGAYAATAITALTAQNTQAVHDIHAVPPAFVAKQIEVVLTDIGADCIKIGMLATVPIIAAVADALASHGPDIPRVVDPVMVATSGGRLLADDAVEALISRLIRGAELVTPNIPEAEVLSGRVIADEAAMAAAAEDILRLGARAVLLKGGHLPTRRLVDLLVTPQGVKRLESDKIDTTNTHGTGCTLASAIAAGIAQGMTLENAVARARDYVWRAIKLAPGLGQGHGPLNHVDAAVLR